MSLVVAIRDKDRIVLGADKQTSVSDFKDHSSTKIWPVEELPGALMGSVGTARASQIIQYTNVIDKNLINGEISTDFIICSLAPTIAAGLKANGIVVESSETSTCEMMPNAFIFAYQDKAWMIWNDLSVTEIEDYLAIGSGSDVARGALYATKKSKNPFERIVTSIDAAAESTLFVDDGIDLLATKAHKDDTELVATAFGYKIKKKPTEEKKKK